jgi:mevalonate kinase
MSHPEFYSNGKILLSGEYMVLNGSTSLVLPLKLGQLMQINKPHKNTMDKIFWNSTYNDSVWFRAEFNISDFTIIHSSNQQSANYILRILQEINAIRPEYFKKFASVEVHTYLNFSPAWGLGSSSTLIANLARWTAIDPFLLSNQVSNGSGFDIAASFQKGPFIYQKYNNIPDIRMVDFNPPFLGQIYFVYLGFKQNSEQEVLKYKPLQPKQSLIERISAITESLVLCKDLGEFESLITEHERLMSDFLMKKKVKDLLFPDFEGTVKSLGAWGGDFVMMASKHGPEYITKYLKSRNFQTFFSYDDIVLPANHNYSIAI